MLKVIDLDQTGKERDRDAYIFTLSVGGEKIGVTEEELADLIRAKAGVQKGSGKKGRKAHSSNDNEQESQSGQDYEASPGDNKSPAWLGQDAQNLA